MSSADIVVLPYSYILDPKLRKNLQVDLEGSIIFFDEAHNLEIYCDELLSFEMSQDNFKYAVSYLKIYLKNLNKKEAKEGFSYDSKNRSKEISHLIQFLSQWHDNLKKAANLARPNHYEKNKKDEIRVLNVETLIKTLDQAFLEIGE